VRSLQRDELVVRLPDEIPPAEPSVRLIIDNELAGTQGLTCSAPDELLDAMVRVWLGAGNALVAKGTRVTLAAAIDQGVVERTLIPRASERSLGLGARIAWQTATPLEAIVANRHERQLVVSCRPRRLPRVPHLAWLIVPEVLFTTPESVLALEEKAMHSFPAGSVENRPHRRARERVRTIARLHDRAFFAELVSCSGWTRFAGDYIARINDDRVVVEVI
jgi:hypothetical protein